MNRPRSPLPKRVHPPAVAGLFYPDDPDTLRESVENHLAAGAQKLKSSSRSAPLQAVYAPHAGYLYSGDVAGVAYATISAEATRFTEAVILGPSHRVAFSGLALPGADAMSTPLGDVLIDSSLQARALAHPAVVELPEAHQFEHSIEVQLPFVRAVLPGRPILPLVIGDAPAELVADVLMALVGETTLTIVSTDLSHFLSDAEARALDRRTSDDINGLSITIGPEQACGCRGVNGFNLFAERQGYQSETLCLANSSDTAGSADRVVGYGAFAVR